MKKWLKRHRPAPAVIVALITGLVMFGCGAAIIFAANKLKEPEKTSAFVTVSSTLLGSFFAFLGVILTLYFNSRVNQNKVREAHKPEVFLPTRFDHKDVIRVFVTLEKGDNFIANRTIYLKNSDKAAFRIKGVVVDGTQFKTKTTSFIEKGNLFCLAFYKKDDPEIVQLTVESLDNQEYTFLISKKDGNYDIKERA